MVDATVGGVTQAPERPRVAAVPRLALPRVRRDGRAWLPALLLAVRTTAYGLIAVELVVLLLWVATPHTGSGAAATLRLGLTFWAAAHHAAVHVTGPGGATGTIGVVPLGLTLWPGWLLYRGARRVYDEPAMEPIAFVPALAACYGMLVAAVAVAARGPVSAPVPAEGFVGGAALAVVASLLAAVRSRGVPPRVPQRAVRAAGGAFRASAVVLGAGLILAVVTVAVGHGPVLTARDALHPGAAGSAGLVLLDLLAVPHASVWGGAVLAGPGFGLGAHTSVSLAGSTLGPVPALPVLAALPATGGFPWYAFILLLVPVLGGVLASRYVLSRGASGWHGDARTAAETGAAAGVLWAVLAYLTDGSAGPGRLAVAGPSPWQVGLAVAGEVAVGVLLVAAIRDLRRRGSVSLLLARLRRTARRDHVYGLRRGRPDRRARLGHGDQPGRLARCDPRPLLRRLRRRGRG